MRKGFFLALMVLVALPLAAQQSPLRFPAPSPHASVSQTVGLTDISIAYSRPGVKGRQIWGALVPYDKPWRTGANEATAITFGDDVTINGQKLAKGKYAFFAIPTPTDWTLIFNSVAEQWGSLSYNPAKDALKVTVKPEKAPFTEWLTYEFPNVSNDAATIVLRWENLAVPFTVNTGTTAKAVAAAREAVANAKADDWSTPYRAASFAFTNGLGEDATRWLDASLKAKETIQNLYLKARMQAKAGSKAAAVKTAEQALAKAGEKDKELAGEIQASIKDWQK